MGWLSRWLGKWGSRWLGYQAEQSPAAPYTRYGRIWKPAKDRLFSFQEGDLACEISPGAVILQRQPRDDYVRFRLPDTNCPPLPRPNAPLDDGVADRAEPVRWGVGGDPDTQAGWTIKKTPTTTDYVQLTYTCFHSGDFEIEFELGVAEIVSGTNPGYVWVDAVGVQLSADADNWVFLGRGRLYGADCWGVFGKINGSDAPPAEGWNWMVTGSRGRIRRQGSQISFTVHDSQGNQVAPPRAITNPNMVGPLTVSVRGMGFGYVRSDLVIRGTCYYIRTLTGYPSSVWVSTPVVDIGLPLRVEPKVYPSVLLEWRASNTPFGSNDSSPPWNNPQGEFRYWQVRASTSSISTLIERVELFPDAVPLLVWRRFRSYWQLFETGAGRLTKGPFRTVFGSGPQQRTGADEWTQMNDEERNVGDW